MGLFEFEPTRLDGVVVVHQRRLGDERGSFTKTVHAEEFARAGLRTDFREQYVSTSAPGVVRGMHFQLPPMDHAKYVVATSGRVLDVILDVRPGSATFGEHVTVELSPGGAGVHLPIGVAHGFCVLGDEPATMLYNVTSVHSADHDAGVRWDSFGFEWPLSGAPTLSARDQDLPELAAFTPPAAWSVG